MNFGSHLINVGNVERSESTLKEAVRVANDRLNEAVQDQQASEQRLHLLWIEEGQPGPTAKNGRSALRGHRRKIFQPLPQTIANCETPSLRSGCELTECDPLSRLNVAWRRALPGSNVRLSSITN